MIYYWECRELIIRLSSCWPSMGAFITYGYSTWQLFTRPDPQLYYDSGSMILVLVNLGRYVEAAARAFPAWARTPAITTVTCALIWC